MAKAPERARRGAEQRRGRRRTWAPGLAVLCLGLAVAAILLARHWPVSFSITPNTASAPSVRLEDEKAVFARYGGSPSCQNCHEEEFADWQASHHGLAERKLSADRDRRAFDPPRSFGQGPGSTRVAWLTNHAEVTSAGREGKPETFTVSGVIGEDPLRQFLLPFPQGRLQALESAYDPRSNEWFDIFGNEERRPGEWGHWTGRGMNWNSMCASCHNTRLRRNYDEKTDSYHTTMAEQSVGCEACHGSLKAHNQWQQQYGKSGRKDPTLTKLSKAQVVDNCGACHARRVELTGDFKPGDAFGDNFRLSLVDNTDTYYPDGQVRDEDYEYASFLSSRMQYRGVSCLDCHNPHTAKTILPGNWLCMRCHDGSYTNAPLINPVTHSHHKVYGRDTNGVPVNFDLKAYNPKQIPETGGECVNCHMPQTAYMQRHWRHDHGFTIPDPLLTQQFGIPNACNRCHQDKDTAWAMTNAAKWYGPLMERPTRARAQWLARARRGEAAAREPLLQMLSQQEIPYWRAAAADLLEPWAAEGDTRQALVRTLSDTNDLVRSTAARVLETGWSAAVPGVEAALKQRLEDPVRNVRLAAAWSLRSGLDLTTRAGKELVQHLDANVDQPSGQMQAGVFCYSRNDLAGAAEHLQKALTWDPYSTPVRLELAVVLSLQNRPQQALELLKTGCGFTPQDPELRFQLGLAYNEVGNVAEAARQLAQAVQLNPHLARAWYNLGLAQNALGQPEVALESLVRAEEISAADARIPYARATILAALGRTGEATTALRRALEIQPRYPEAQQLLEQLTR